VERNSPIHSRISATEKEEAFENEAKTKAPDPESI
jgi:hypothetical protein